MLASFRRVPLWISVLIVLDIAVVAAPALDFALGSPYAVVRSKLNLDSEHSLPAWYSSMQWFCAGVMFGFIVLAALRGDGRKHLPSGFFGTTGLALVCVGFSAEEIIGIHEWLGQRSDALLPGRDRAHTPVPRTGIWPILIGIPVVALLALMIRQMRRIFLPAKPALRLLIIGGALMFSGALIVELTVNLIDVAADGRGLVLLQLICEEFLEMLGVSFIVWSAYELLCAYGFGLQMPARIDPTIVPGDPSLARSPGRLVARPGTLQPDRRFPL